MTTDLVGHGSIVVGVVVDMTLLDQTEKKVNDLDEDGYPTEEFLTSIEIWRDRPYTELMDRIKPIWRFSDFGYWTQQEEINQHGRLVTAYRLSTGGWSGNEDIIRALQDNQFFWSLCWYSSHRGGHYVFEVRN